MQTGQSQITNHDPRVIWSRSCWELIIDSLENLPNFLQKESHVLYTLTPIYLQNNTLFPCSSSSTMSACWGPFLNEWCFKHAQPFPQTLSITASLPVSTTVNPSLWCAVRLYQHPGRVSRLVLKSSRVTWLHFSWFCFPLLVIEGICRGLSAMSFHSSPHSTATCVQVTSCNAGDPFISSGILASPSPLSTSTGFPLVWNPLTHETSPFPLISHPLKRQLDPFLLQTSPGPWDWHPLLALTFSI